MIFLHYIVNNGHINLWRLWYWTTLSQWSKTFVSILSLICNKCGLILIFRTDLHVSYKKHFEAMSEIVTFHSATQKTVDLPLYVYVNWRKMIFIEPKLRHYSKENLLFRICLYSNTISLVWGQLPACLSIIFIWCTYIIFWHHTVNNGHMNLQKL